MRERWVVQSNANRMFVMSAPDAWTRHMDEAELYDSRERAEEVIASRPHSFQRHLFARPVTVSVRPTHD
jgi:hypothetical protein